MAVTEIPCQLGPISPEAFEGASSFPVEIPEPPAPQPVRTDSPGPVRIDEDHFVDTLLNPRASGAGLTRLAGGGTSRPVEICSDSAPTLAEIREAMTALRGARVAAGSDEAGSADLARLSLLDAHRAIQTLSQSTGCGSDVAAHLRNRYFAILDQVGTDGMPEDLVSEINHFMVENPDGSISAVYADHSDEIEVESEFIEIGETEAHVEPGSTMTCTESEGSTYVTEDGVTITVEPGVECDWTPPAS